MTILRRFDRIQWLPFIGCLLVLMAATLAIGSMAWQLQRQQHADVGRLPRSVEQQARLLNLAYVDVLRAKIELNEVVRQHVGQQQPASEAELWRTMALVKDARIAFDAFSRNAALEGESESVQSLAQPFHELLKVGFDQQILNLSRGMFSALDAGQQQIAQLESAFGDRVEHWFAQRGRQALAASSVTAAPFDYSLYVSVAVLLLLILLIGHRVQQDVYAPLACLGESSRLPVTRPDDLPGKSYPQPLGY